MIVYRAHVLHDHVPTLVVGEVAALTVGKTVTAMVMAVHDIAAPDGGRREALVTLYVFAESVQELDDTDRFRAGRPGLYVNGVPVIGSEQDFFVVYFVHGSCVAGREMAARPSMSNMPSLASSSVE